MNLSLQRVWAIVLRNILAERRNFMRISDALYWPILDISLWGFTTSWLEKSHQQMPNLVLMVLTGLVLWQVVMRANYEISIPLIEEIWNKSFVSLFATPLTIWEWIIGVMITGVIKTCFVLVFGVLIVWLFYSLNIFVFGWMLIPFVISLIMFGWVTGFLGASMIVYWGQKVQNLPWIMAFLFAPVSAVYYPIEALPHWLQTVAYSLPLPYIFEGMRSVILEGKLPVNYLAISFLLNIIYLALALLLFKYMFEKSRIKGLDRL